MDTFYLNNAVRLLEKFLENTESPYYAGVVEYGDRKPHGWGPEFSKIITMMAEHIAENAPKGATPARWKY